ncbi:Uncharacterized protein TCAP_04430 [Tolypocladium capitatum]|uniref:DUF8004 domain-containing protein n=1 Tax=Tolypocladium capitatum TaxID=45235 RepID=A0A2K3QDN8_9HYPO|nr:Uncharacterized protein TCAP_04430 [Tolypocladium capitatum]
MAPASSTTTSSRPVSRASIANSCTGSGTAPIGALKQRDGATRTRKEWDSPGRDPDLWMHDGNCFVYLHGKGRSKRGPSFKLPFPALLAAKCFPFIQRFLVTDGYRPGTADEIGCWYRVNPRRTVELYVPPPTADRARARLHHLATRNFLAWVVRRSIVGEHLGNAMVALLHSMHEFRTGVEDNVGDLLNYLEEEGYLLLAGQPSHAMALLFLAESFQLSQLYIRAFAHCVGMSERLCSSTEYHNISVASRKLIRQARTEMDARLDRVAAMLGNFLDEQLSEAHVGIPPGIRAHLERFRSFLLSFYSTKLGYYPPRSFDANVCRAMGDDFSALYKLLEDDGSCEFMPSPAAGGICTLQIVQSFDRRNEFEPLEHPLPLLPQLDQQGGMKRIAWLPRRGKGRSEQRQLEYAALVRASNWREDIFRNDLVRAYRGFEEDSVVWPNKADRYEKASLVDARKVRWILIYAIHQTLRHANKGPTGPPADGDTRLPWKEAHDVEPLVPRQTDMATEDAPLATWGDASLRSFTGGIEIKPDIDYFALTHEAPPPRGRRSSVPTAPDIHAQTISRSNSVTRVLRRSSTLRRSIQRFKQATSTPPPTALAPPNPIHDEIVVHGYGNGRNSVNPDAGEMRLLDTSVKWASRSGSTASQSDSGASSAFASTASPTETLASTVTSPTLNAPNVADAPLEAAPHIRRWSQQDVMPSKTAPPASGVSKSNSIKRRPISAAIESYNYAKSFGQFVENEGRNMLAGATGGSRRHSTTIPELKRKCSMPQVRSTPLPRVIDEEPGMLARDSCDWTAMQAFLDGKTARVDTDGNAMAAWEQYADLGGLTEVR